MSQLLDPTYAVAPFRTSTVVPLLRATYGRTQWCAAVADAVGLPVSDFRNWTGTPERIVRGITVPDVSRKAAPRWLSGAEQDLVLDALSKLFPV